MEIQGFNNYLIYPDGKVFSKKSNKYIYIGLDRGGYKRCYMIDNNKKQITKRIHRLLAENYIPKIEGKEFVDHIDRDKQNNSLDNLRWVTKRENCENRPINKNNKCGHKNICYDEKNKRYHFYKKIKGIKYDKYFKNLEDAIQYKNDFILGIVDLEHAVA